MSKYISTILGASEPQFSASIKNLEQASLNMGVDVRYGAEIRQGILAKMRELDLDPSDTTGTELFQSLRVKALQDDAVLREVIKIPKTADSVSILHKLATYYRKNYVCEEVWSLKRTVIKKIISSHVPHKTMKALHYRSTLSMLKRESAAEIYAVATLIEGDTYKQKIMADIKNLKASDFEIRKIDCIGISPERWLKIKKHLKKSAVPVFAVPEANCIVVLPAETTNTACLVLLASALILSEIRRVKEHASYLKLRSLDKNLHKHVQKIAASGHIETLTIHDQQVYWRHLHQLFSGAEVFPDYLEPHVSAQDIKWTALEASLTGIDARLSFWLGTHQLAFVSADHVVSLHVIDVCFNELYKLPIQDGSKQFVGEAVWDELLMRYLQLSPFSNMVERYMYKMTDTEPEFMYDKA